MKYILTKEEVTLADKTAIENFGIPAAILMENAARSAAEIITKILPNEYEGKYFKRNILIVCGSGNNGGDGFALARHLHELNNVFVFWYGDENKMSHETKINFEIVKKLEIFCQKIESEKDLNYINWNAECIVESMIGVGGNEYLRGLTVPILQKINQAKGIKIAIDIPAGLNANSGNNHPDCFKADHTITMFAPKIGLFLKKAPEICGLVHTANLGASSKIVKSLSNIRIIEADDFFKLMPKRERISSKFNYGRVGIIAGSNDMSGAAALVANASIKSGAGLVELITPKVHSKLSPNIISHEIQTDDGFFTEKNYEEVLNLLEKCNVIAIGPGLGNRPETVNFVRNIYDNLADSKIKVLDADALRILDDKKLCKPNTVITPHFIEFSRLSNISAQDVLDDTLTHAINAAKSMNCIVLLKHIPTVITDGISTYLNVNGNSGMATAGSGDVLTGIIAGLAAQKIDLLTATALAAYWHAFSGDYYAENYDEYTLTAEDIIENLKNV